GMLGRSRCMRELFRRIERLSRGEAPVLVEGETGVGKRLSARTLHELGDGNRGPFVLLDAGRIEERRAAGGLRSLLSQTSGTLFLAEVGELSGETQQELSHLLRVRRQRSLVGLDSGRPGSRIVCSTTRDLRGEVERGLFREELYASLRAAVVSVPSLRERRDDLPLLIAYFLTLFGDKYGKRIAGVAPAAMALLVSHRWEGNVRELKNEVERAVVLTPAGEEIEPKALSPDLAPPAVHRAPDAPGLKQRSREMEKRMVAQALAGNGWNVAATARDLGISRVGLSKKLKVLDMKRPARNQRAPHN
ncbi:MAG TPA: sigma 54-interacting transcriptional regulator, partial [Thermoanaerobaculia bacterium]|nr:sigma 54-interacting transcriptional regulator [Thermoanaerobaculia bacterium]